MARNQPEVLENFVSAGLRAPRRLSGAVRAVTDSVQHGATFQLKMQRPDGAFALGEKGRHPEQRQRRSGGKRGKRTHGNIRNRASR